jgi:hypothetical protein
VMAPLGKRSDTKCLRQEPGVQGPSVSPDRALAKPGFFRIALEALRRQEPSPSRELSADSLAGAAEGGPGSWNPPVPGRDVHRSQSRTARQRLLVTFKLTNQRVARIYAAARSTRPIIWHLQNRWRSPASDAAIDLNYHSGPQ